MYKFETRKWKEANDLSNGQQSVNKNKRFKPPVLRSDLRDYSDAYIYTKGAITVVGTTGNNRIKKQLAFKNNVPFSSCISNIINAFIDNLEEFDIVMWMYNLLEYSVSYSMTLGSLLNYY